MSDKNLVVGAGISGATIANLLANELGEEVLVVDKRPHIGGNCYDYRDENGIMIHKYGSHIFHTKSEKVWNYIRQFTDFNTYMHKVIGLLDGIETHIPFNFNTLYDVFPKSFAQKLEDKLLDVFQINTKVPILEFQAQDDDDLKFLANYVYQKIFLYYTTKQWGVSPKEVDDTVTERVPVYLSKDNRYFQDRFQGIPLEGYTKVIENMLNSDKIEIRLNTSYDKVKDEKFKRIFYTGSIDKFFGYKYGQLPYRSVRFKLETHNKEYYQSNSVINYPCNYDFTRIHEYKYYLDDKSDKTVIAKEYSEEYVRGQNGRYYPIASPENNALYEKYHKDALALENVYFFGRLGDYMYYDMDKAILRALELFEEIKNK
ncbi:MAG: UDP-galactopyranose mutase [Candidatus Gastranaerophilaceae bacterium]|nr:UDP-galactopyranose mutase [Candidatus Gastranaerophilaceae bacterium]